MAFARYFFLVCTMVLTCDLGRPAHGAPILKTGMVIRDSELEHTLKSFITPIFRVAGLDGSRLQLIMVVDPEWNAWASSNHTIGIHTGLMIASDTPEQLIGVLAHETGHIAGGHIVGLSMTADKSQRIAMASVLLGALAAVAGGGDAAMGTMSAGMQAAMNHFMHFSRGQEGAADSAGVRYLDALGWSSIGLLEFMQKLAAQEFLSPDRQISYMRSHPFSQDRVSFLKNHVDKSPMPSRTLPQDFYPNHLRLVAKLKAYLESPQAVYLAYKKTDGSLPARYARSIAHYREGRMEDSLALLDGLIKEHPSDPYFHELRGQILFDDGKIPAAAMAYETALRYAPGDVLMGLMYARILIELGQPHQLKKAGDILAHALSVEPDNGELFHLQAIVYGKAGRIGDSALALSEEALRNGQYERAANQAKRAMHLLSKGPAFQRAQDIKDLADREKERLPSDQQHPDDG